MAALSPPITQDKPPFNSKHSKQKMKQVEWCFGKWDMMPMTTTRS